MARTIFDAAQAISQHAGIAPAAIAMALKIIGYQCLTPGLHKILRRAESMAERFEELRIPCPGLNEVIDCFILAGRLANHVSPKTDSYGKRTQSINASEDAVFSLDDLELGEFQKDLFAISWIIQSVVLIQPLQVERIASTISLLDALQRNLDKQESTVTENLRSYPFWERLQHLCTLCGDEYSSHQYQRLREALRQLSTLRIAGLQLPTLEPKNSIQLRLTERHLTTAHWHFPRPTDLKFLQSFHTDKRLAESSPNRIESLIIMIALTTARDINQALAIQILTRQSNRFITRHIGFSGA